MALPRWCYRVMSWLMFRLPWGPSLLLWVMDYAWRVLFACCAGLGLALVWRRFGWRVTAAVILGFVVYTVIVLLAAQYCGFNGSEEKGR